MTEVADAMIEAASLIETLQQRIERQADALEAIKELADADETLLCWKTANDALKEGE